MTSATEELRSLLNERGVEWTDKAKDLGVIFVGFAETRWNANGFRWCYIESGGNATLATCSKMEIRGCTPEQAIAATLGSEQLEMANELLRRNEARLIKRIEELEELARDADWLITRASWSNTSQDEFASNWLFRMAELGIEVD